MPVSQWIWTPHGFGPRFKSASGYGPPFVDLDPLSDFPFKHPLYHIRWLIPFRSFLSMFFSMTKKPAILFQFYRICYSESYSICKNLMWTNHCIWTIEIVTVNLCFFWCESTLIRNVIKVVETIASCHKNDSVWFSKIVTLNSFWTNYSYYKSFVKPMISKMFLYWTIGTLSLFSDAPGQS